jgi:DNA invertase Pin-like site-specific DNA recombinase
MVDQIPIDMQNPIKTIRAAEYVRMSTDQQQFSIAYQQAAIRLYAAQRGITVIRTYADEGISGLTLIERPAMIQLLADVESGTTDFDIVLVYDVSRWGRYQDTDEGAYHEYRCRKAGKNVEYCAEQFTSEITPLNAVIKAIKRAMAAEYSRELAVRTHSAQVRGASQGFLQGGIAGYGLRRLLIGADGEPKGLLPQGAAKSLRTDRVVLVPGPPEEIAVIRRIFDLFVSQHMFKKRIAKLLNAEGVPFTGGRRWNEHHIRFLLSNERYVGTLVFGKTSSLLRMGKGHGRIRSAPGIAVRGIAGYEPIVSRVVFAAANEPKFRRGAWYRDEALLEPLRRLWHEHGYLSHRLIETTKGIPSPQTYRKRFGTLRDTYKRIGYLEQPDRQRLVHYARTREIVLRIVKKLNSAAERKGWSTEWNWQRRVLTLDESTQIRITTARHLVTRQNRKHRWEFETDPNRLSRILLVIRLDQCHAKAIDYFLLPPTIPLKRVNFIDDRNVLSDYRCAHLTTVCARVCESQASFLRAADTFPVARSSDPATNAFGQR